MYLQVQEKAQKDKENAAKMTREQEEKLKLIEKNQATIRKF